MYKRGERDIQYDAAIGTAYLFFTLIMLSLFLAACSQVYDAMSYDMQREADYVLKCFELATVLKTIIILFLFFMWICSGYSLLIHFEKTDDFPGNFFTAVLAIWGYPTLCIVLLSNLLRIDSNGTNGSIFVLVYIGLLAPIWILGVRFFAFLLRIFHSSMKELFKFSNKY